MHTLHNHIVIMLTNIRAQTPTMLSYHAVLPCCPTMLSYHAVLPFEGPA